MVGSTRIDPLRHGAVYDGCVTYYIPGGYGQVIHRLGLTGDPDDMFVTLGWSADSALPDLAVAADSLHDAFKAFWVAKGSDQYTLKSTKVTYVEVTGDPPAEIEHVESAVGTVSSNVFPQNTAFLVHKNTGLGGRHNKGRWYLPGAFESLVSPTGVVDATYLAGYNTSLATLRDAYYAATEVLAVVLLHNPRTADPTPAPTNLLSLTLDPVVATQRRRLRK